MAVTQNPETLVTKMTDTARVRLDVPRETWSRTD